MIMKTFEQYLNEVEKTLRGHVGNSGIQAHSAGDIHPYRITTYGSNGKQYDQAEHNNGWTGKKHPWVNGDNKAAYAAAKADIEAHRKSK